jgi:hypothetical protein
MGAPCNDRKTIGEPLRGVRHGEVGVKSTSGGGFEKKFLACRSFIWYNSFQSLKKFLSLGCIKSLEKSGAKGGVLRRV